VSTQDTIAKLEGLLERVQRNAQVPRGIVAGATSEAESEPMDSDAPYQVSGSDAETLKPDVAAAIPIVAAPVHPAPLVNEPIEAPAPEAGSAPELEVVEEEFDEDDLEDVELLEDDIVEISAEDELIEEDDLGIDVEVDDDDEESAPISSRRPIAPASLDEALSGAAESLDDEDDDLEAPLKTPPPESGPQASIPVGELTLTEAQLGGAVDLEEATAAPIELDSPPPPVASTSVEDDLEVSLPLNTSASEYKEDLAPPSRAGDELEAHRRRQAKRERALASTGAGAQITGEEPLKADVTARPAASTTRVAVSVGDRTTAPSTFIELLDSSLDL
jgi:hypothetical protein